MDTILLVVTGTSLALAAGMGVLLTRMLREERRRSDARVQLLEELAAGAGSARPRRADPDLRLTAREFTPAPAAAPVAAADIPLRRTVPVQDLFHEEAEPSPWPRRFAVIGGLAALLTVTILGWSQMRGGTPEPAATVAATAAPPLELLSLRHTREGNTLTVTGLVQNPKGASALSNVQATVFVFGPGGTFLTSARAPLDFTSLAPGDETPFVVRVPVTGPVSRYRVGFRGADDRVVGHVDRRTDQVGRSF